MTDVELYRLVVDTGNSEAQLEALAGAADQAAEAIALATDKEWELEAALRSDAAQIAAANTAKLADAIALTTDKQWAALAATQAFTDTRRSLNAALERAASHEQSAATATARSASALNETAKAASAAAAAKKQNASASNDATAGSQRLGQGLMQLGFALDDVQYGMKGLSNNIPGLLTSFGTGAGLAGVISIVAIGAYQLYSHWDQLMGLMGMGKVKSQADEMEELAKKTEKTADETARLLKYQERQATVTKQRGAKTDAESEQEKLVNEAIAKNDNDVVVRGLAQLKMGTDPRVKALERQQAHEEQIRRISTNGRAGLSDDENARFERRRGALANTIDAEVRDQLAKATHDPGALQGLVNKVTSNPEAFGGREKGMKLAAGLMDATPDAIAARRDNAKAEKEGARKKKLEQDTRKQKDEEDDYEYEKLLESNRRWKEGKQRKKQETNDRVGKVRKKEPNLDEMLETMMLEAAKNGGFEGGNKMAGQLFQKLKGTFGEDVAKQLVGDAGSSAKKKYLGEMLDPGKVKSSQTLGGADFAKSIQAGVSNANTPERQLKVLEAISKQIDRIVQKPTTDNAARVS